MGRDTLAALMYGAQTSLGVGLVATVVSLVLGVGIGGLAGYAGGRTESLLMRGTVNRPGFTGE